MSYASIRLRREKDENGNKTYYIQSKDNGNGLIRQEWGEVIPREVFEWLWPNAELCWVKKTRFIFVDEQGYTLEFDEFHKTLDGLFLMECEFESYEAAYAYVPPNWVEIVREVTEDKRFGNKSLAKKGWPRD